MSEPGSYFDLETVRDYIISRGGTIANQELVKYFRKALTNPATKEAARIQFKAIVNILSTIVRGDDGEKYLVLKKKYAVSEGQNPPGSSWRGQEVEEPPAYKPPPPPSDIDLMNVLPAREWSPAKSRVDVSANSSPSTPIHPRITADVYSGSSSSSPATSRPASMRSSVSRESVSTPPPSSLRSSVSRESISSQPPASVRSSTSRDSVSTPPPLSNRSSVSRESSSQPTSHRSTPTRDPIGTPPLSPESPPPVPPRRKSSDKINNNFKETNSSESKENKRPKSFAGETEKLEGASVEDSKISVRERLQKFNKLATENQLTETPFRSKKRFEKITDKDEDDSASVNSLQLDPKFREWNVKCAQGEYQPLAKMAAENPRLVKMKNTANGYTALHWAAKYGNQDLVKLIAGTYGANVNARTNGGYTALHIAMQFGHEDLYNLLVKVYGADPGIRDWSGKKARQYLTNKDTSLSADTFRKLKARKKQSEHGFLRIGSLNVRVKKTTEAFSNFLGVGQGDKLHKNWGSADDLPQDEDCKKMPPPNKVPTIKKRKSKRPLDFGQSGGGTYTRTVEKTVPDNAQDSDSDTAAGFGSRWQSTV